LARGIKNVLNDPELARSMVEKGRAEYEANFTEDIVVNQYLEFFEKVTAPCAASPV
jgi:glycosyltransferase involved in cell wall biosynthesis